MSVKLKILGACFCFVAIITVVGGLAWQQGKEMGRLAVSIYDHAFMGMSYVDQTQEEFLRFVAEHRKDGETLAGAEARAGLQKVLDRLDVALERAATDRTRDAGKQTRALLAALADAPADDLAKKLKAADASITRLVKRFSADGLEARDDADDLATRSAQHVLIEIGCAIALALALGWLVGRSLSNPLVQLVRIISQFAAGELGGDVPARLTRRRDEIGAVARTAAVFRDAMRDNAQAEQIREWMRQKSDGEKRQALLAAADSIERETTHVAARSIESGTTLTARAEELAASAARVLASVAEVTEASAAALHRSEAVAATGEELSASAREIAAQIGGTAAEITSAARAGERARDIIGQLSAAVGQIGAVSRLIGDIAARTNLLALNATIEAARAGEAGRGFAVVAGEVKSLANQTARSTEQIARNAGAIQQATQDAVEVVGEMVERVASIERITQAVAAAAEEQTAATGEIARNVAGAADAMRAVSAQIGAVTHEARGTDEAVSEMRALADTVGQNIAELRGVMIRIVRQSSPDSNRRESARVPINAPCGLHVDGAELAATCVDLSLGGARLSAAQPVMAGSHMLLRLPGLPDLSGHALSAGTDVRMRFDWNTADAPPALRDYLARLTEPAAAA